MQRQILGKMGKIIGVIFLYLVISQGLKIDRVYAENKQVAVKAETVTDWNQVSSADWMKYVDGEKKISEVTIPGSHDSATKYIPLSYIAQCQDSSIAEQLETGIRFLDIRLKSKEIKEALQFELCHGFLSCRTSASIFADKLTFKSVLEDCYEFLEKHPTETIIMAIKHEYGSHSDKEVQTAIYKLLEEEEENKWYLQNDNPTLEQVRGKIILARRYEDENNYGESEGGLDFRWKNQDGTDIANIPYEENAIKDGLSLLVQDRFEYEADDKWEAVEHSLEQSESDEIATDNFFLNYLSTKGSKIFAHPKEYADILNEKLLEYDLQEDSNYGILIMDFVTEEMARKVYQSNSFAG